MGTRTAVLLLLFGLVASACASPAAGPEGTALAVEVVQEDIAAERLEPQVNAGSDAPSVATNPTEATNLSRSIQTGEAGSGLHIAIGSDGSRAVVGGPTVSVISSVSASSSVAITSSSAASDGSSVLNVSVTTGSGSVNRTVRLDGTGRFLLRVTAEGDGLPVIQVEEVGP